MKLISVIMPYYKKKKFIYESLNSVLKQSYKNLEIIIIYDDEDKTDLKDIKRLAKIDRRIKVLINKKKLGAGNSRNRGIKYSKGSYIAFLDCDDLWKKNKLKKQINFMTKKKISASFTSYNIINIKNKILGKMKAKKKIVYNDLLKSCDIGLSSVMIKKNILLDNLFPNLKTKEDYVLWLKITKKDIYFYGINNFLTDWRKLNNSLSSSILQKLFDGFKVYKVYLKLNFFTSIYYLLRLSFNFLVKKMYA